MNIFDKQNLVKILPSKIHLTTSNGNFKLSKSDFILSPPQIQISYHHSTPEDTADVLTDGEPDYLGFDIQLVNSADGNKCKVDITYGDAMMFSFDILSDGRVSVGNYNGYGSKFDPKYEFYFQEETISELISFFEKITGFNLKRSNFKFLDGDKNSYKIEKVRFVSDFKTFNLLNRP